MTGLGEKVQNALDEARILVLGAQILIGFQYESVFESRFDTLQEPLRMLKTLALGLLLVAFALLASPASYHRLVEEGRDSPVLHRFTMRMVGTALAPFALGLALELFVVGRAMGTPTVGLVAGIVAVTAAFFFWYGLGFIYRRPMNDMDRTASGGGDLNVRIRHLLTEIRVVLPGVQALLGFQLIAVLTDAFARLPSSLRTLHGISLALMAASIILLMTPAALHRLADRGENTERFHRIGGRLLLTAMLPLALGICLDFFVVLAIVTGSFPLSLLLSSAMFLLFLILWLLYPLWQRGRPA